ncbi:MAG: galactose-1-phosphate uridylyltransferase [Candidatus Doudnabacteria bacterium RIFCSPHIGHO2_02_FULL_48_21]|uniref:Galactose-1-phosphate uridylyltransferase n=1 Tax=Candidatus Doudnabacteria bacterium RIFCSPLOWO2_02_FULL_48_13 TaxID=1817845 RepID=A0A1F5QC59_9BACT|nr:MAG: galactose-1-phosphate uridylyltransferase [Candidatus Doudnabacteria bacterium RIFCSPHIGHO2_01_48_18]OGE77536.1 MAG: galactose-1-phosphate uridylyltransferase [Candidatus Doudnabacteria bacterium RIFCSPHIGHO2_01_FULL_48_180]OGE91677.1 MAG: galactose-1-phosphate uridylyltransferase [Candidatus Doudnabacteria bacterium RIFCSPHIGHO2_12_FULL_47_25]OGE93371.1 MAG: galactose-1-phosphate uridylyltransferase [Candidatus Doudnabacteria bacterium RIFCSPHIGHO2_02_FULL_48_21]OGE97455.1 MAG: galacto
MSEFRQDIVSKNWILIADHRDSRPNDFKEMPATPIDLPEISKECAFCAGNETQTGPEIARYPAKGEWLVRVVPNKYEAVGHVIGKRSEDFYISRPGIGDHEVVITRNHNQPVAKQDVELIDLNLQAYIDRFNDLSLHDEVQYIHTIQNHGLQAGASIVHPHSQIFAIPFLPHRIIAELLGTREYYAVNNTCVYCQIVMFEMKSQGRVILDTQDFLVISPYASKMPFEVHILPKKHRASFNKITISERKALAAVMKDIFSRFYDRMKNPAYNYYIHSLPARLSSSRRTFTDQDCYHWHIVVLPRINVWAGFELGTEVYVNPMPPEKAAEFLR